MANIIASIDQGTTSSRCILFGANGPFASHQLEHRQFYPQPGWVEHDAGEIWKATETVIRGAIERAGIHASEIAAIGITNQRETTVVWDRATGKPCCPAMVWQDTRTRGICDELARDGGVDRFREKTGLPLATYFSGPKLKWILDQHPQVKSAARDGNILFGTIDSWLLWNLTGASAKGVHATDVTNASRTMLMNLNTLDWNDELLTTFDIPRAMLPKIVSSSHASAFGATRETGPFGAAIPVTAMLGDQQAALVGHAALSPGDMKNTYGTGCFMLVNTGREIIRSHHGLLTTVAYQFENSPTHYALEGSVAIAGSLVQWLRDNLGIIQSSSEIEALASAVPDNGGVYIVPAFSGLFAPWWESNARGVIAGLSGYCNKSHIARAALEASAFQTRDVLDAMRLDAERASKQLSIKSLRVDGGMTVNNLLMQFQANILNVPVARSRIAETTALGAARAAGSVVGVEIGAAGESDAQWQPKMDQATRERLHRQWLKAVDRAKGWLE
jgi:glycerol kinase